MRLTMTQIFKDPAQLMSTWADAVTLNDLDLLADVFAVDAEFVNLFGSVWQGRDAIVAGHTWALDSMLKDSTMHFESVEQRAIGDGVVVLRGICRRGRPADASAQTLPPGTTVLMLVAQRDHDGWRAVAGANIAQQTPDT